MVYCSECGSKNEEDNTFCNTCGSALIKPQYFNIRTYDDFNLLLSPQNQKIVKEFSLSVDAYNMIIENIKELGMYNYKEQLSNYTDSQINNMDILSKIALITISFSKINYKSRGAELGSYSFNLINIDDRLDKANQIGTLIHELTHHLVSEIFEQALMYLLEVKKSDALEAFVWFALISSPSSVLMMVMLHTSPSGLFRQVQIHQPTYLQCHYQRYSVFEFQMQCFMPKHLHGCDRSNAAAQKRNDQQCHLRHPPPFADSAEFIPSIDHDCHDIDYGKIPCRYVMSLNFHRHSPKICFTSSMPLL